MRKLKQITYSILYLFFISCNLLAQCPTGNLDLCSQEDLDNFLIEFPNCTEISGNVFIGNPIGFLSSDINNLGGLINLIAISGDLNFLFNDDLVNLNGLNNISSIGGSLEIDRNVNLTSLEGLENLSSIGENLTIKRNYGLNNLQGINNISSIFGSLNISRNDGLVNLDGLNNISSIFGSLNISSNDGLMNLEGLNGISSIGEYLSISSNDDLVNLVGLSSLSGIDSSLIISENDGLINLEGLNNLTTIGLDLIIKLNDGVINLEGLNNLSSIGQNLEIERNFALINLNGLNNLLTVGQNLEIWKFNIIEDAALTNLDGLNNLSSIGGSLEIRSMNELINVDGLNSLIFIGGSLDITNNDALIDLDGFNNLITVGASVNLDGNLVLNDIDGLSNLTTIGEDLRIYINSELVDLDGLSSLNSVGGQLEINGNNDLTNLDGLINLTSLGGNLIIKEHSALNDIDGITNISFFDGSLVQITNNNPLSLCSNAFICNYILNNNEINVWDNGYDPGCDTELEILEGCADYGALYFPMFFDENENGLLDTNEFFLPYASILIEPNNNIVYSNATNGGLRFLEFGDYTVSYNQVATPFWDLTSTNSPSNVTLDSNNPTDTLYFGLTPTQNISSIQVAIANELPRCNQLVNFEAIVNNLGTTITSGILWLNINEEITDVQFIDTPDYEEPLRYGWNFENLHPGYIAKKKISLQLPGPPELEIGDLLTFSTDAIFSDVNGQDQIVEITPVSIEVQCSFDPNDKLSQPSYPENYALIGEDLIYTIRFQNTGNAEAYDVVIEDELDANLDLSTFRVVSSSHQEVLNTFLNNNTITFKFRDIFLPDSTTNFDASQGYVMYSIRPNVDIEDFTVIENTADIYFDSNPPIVTNTTENNMLTTFDADDDGIELWLDCDDSNAAINPSSTEIPNNEIDEDCDGIAQIIDVDMDGFNSDEDCDDTNPDINPDAIEIVGNNIDEDCDGEAIAVTTSNLSIINITITPNPFRNKISLTQSIDKTLNYQLLELTGRILDYGVLEEVNSQLHFNHLIDGIYFLKIIDPETNAFIIEKVLKID